MEVKMHGMQTSFFYRVFKVVTQKKDSTSKTTHKSVSCDICKKEFSQHGYLVRHRKSHAEQKPLRCDVCEKEFSEKGSLVTHQRTHTGENPLKCNVCGKEFAQRNTQEHTQGISFSDMTFVGKNSQSVEVL
jgi:uncharacterized Zn-finger protein